MWYNIFMSRKIKFVEEEYYHIYNRGVDKRTIFLDTQDHKRFMLILAACNSVEELPNNELRNTTLVDLAQFEQPSPLVSIGVYSLMPNHFHILIKEIQPMGISRFMHRLSTAYTMYFNEKYNRAGSLFEGTFKARHVNHDIYLRYLFAYIHLNPLKLVDSKWKEGKNFNVKRNQAFLAEYTSSSYIDYCGVVRAENIIIDRKAFPEYFKNAEEFKTSISSWFIHSEGDW